MILNDHKKPKIAVYGCFVENECSYQGVIVNCSRNKKFELSRDIIKALTMDIGNDQIKQPGGCSNTHPGKTRN
jgi:hypothetical protein